MTWLRGLRQWAGRVFRAAFAVDFVSVDSIPQTLPSRGYAKVGQGLGSNVVMAPVQWLVRAFAQAPVVVQRKRAKKWDDVDGHPLELLLDQPNDFYDGGALMSGLLVSFSLDGNAYLLKRRDELRAVRELWYVPHWLMRPRWKDDGSTFITHYDYTLPGTGRTIAVHPEEVVHVRFGIDPENPRLGLSPLRAALREVLTDEEASVFSAYILSNMGVPGGVISPKDAESRPSTDDIEEMKTLMSEEFTGKKRGRWLVLGSPTEIAQFGFDPNRLQLGPLRDISEERVCACLGLPAAVVGFGAGLQQTKVGATMRELVRLARVNAVEPMQVMIARQLGRSLLPDFTPQPRRLRAVFDNSGISMFQEDETEVAKRAKNLYDGQIAKLNEARGMVGLELLPPEEGDVFKSSSGGGMGGGAEEVPPGTEVDDDGDKEGDDPPPVPPPPANRIAQHLESENGGGT